MALRVVSERNMSPGVALHFGVVRVVFFVLLRDAPFCGDRFERWGVEKFPLQEPPRRGQQGLSPAAAQGAPGPQESFT